MPDVALEAELRRPEGPVRGGSKPRVCVRVKGAKLQLRERILGRVHTWSASRYGELRQTELLDLIEPGPFSSVVVVRRAAAGANCGTPLPARPHRLKLALRIGERMNRSGSIFD
jgi:hypothetical protein